MQDTDLGSKHACSNCGSLFFDFHKSPPTCPVCGTVAGKAPAPGFPRGTDHPHKEEEVPDDTPAFDEDEDADSEVGD